MAYPDLQLPVDLWWAAFLASCLDISDEPKNSNVLLGGGGGGVILAH